MSLKSTPSRYGSVAMAFHWLTALAILALMVTGQMMDGLQDAARQIAILKWHVPMGLAVLLLTLARIAWWFFADRHPAPLGTGWQALAAKAGHTALYALLLVMTVSGVALMALSGAGEVVFFGSTAPLPQFSDYLPRIPHGLGAKLLIALVALHVAAAIWHQRVKRDGAMTRILPVRD
ncbi:MAG: cytochrome b561 [Roseibaca calidilacus]|uniref:Cytochrome b561 n=1 Tax=Roseibaca calidilacus TaxID=1666912 RepID=A0A0P7WJC3_9RHOB|nr:cytochrome b/b6 domain-containing protein [Roseibaca calidilacus]KPP94244.1 MAG: cytochrome b561 [Roseibaca calidilacus]CUX81313.1 cytochrome b561 [Roseibaca calidilacus]